MNAASTAPHQRRASIALEQLLVAAIREDDAVATREGVILDRAHFLADVMAWRAGFAASKVKRCALHCHDSFEFACALFGAWAAGVCVWLPADVLPATLQRLDARVDGYAGDVPAASDRRLVSPDRAALVETANVLDRDAELLVVFTSGSTGAPVAIVKRLAQLFDEVTALAGCWDDVIGDAQVLATVSHQHIYGLLFRVLWPLASGRPFAATRLAFPEDIARELALHPSLLVASPAHLKRLPQNLPWPAARAMLRGVYSSGGPLPDAALPDCRDLLGCAPIEVYGSSETGGIAWRQRNRYDDLAWQLLPGVEATLEEDCLRVRSPHIAVGDGVLSADRVALVDGGFVLLGRADRIVKIEEKRVSLSALEAHLVASGLVDAARTVLLPEARPQLGVGVVPSVAGWAMVDAHGRRAYSDALRECLGELVEASVRPRRWRLLWALPVNALGKTTEADMLALFDPRRPPARLLERDDGHAVLAIEAAPDLPYFDGHFAGAPVLAGVVQLEWAVHFGRELFALRDGFQRLDVLKFQQVVRPGDALQLSLHWDEERTTLTFGYTSQAGPHSGGRIVFGGEG